MDNSNELDLLQNQANAYALEVVNSIFSSEILAQTCFCLAGGCFKKILPIQVIDSKSKPRDLDIFPCSDNDKEILLSYLKKKSTFSFLCETDYNTKFSCTTETNETLLIEIASKTSPSHLREKLSGFDLILSVMGVEFHYGEIVDVYIHPNIPQALEQQEIQLAIPMPNEPFLLATAERVLRYAKELNFPPPKKIVDYLIIRFHSKSEVTKLAMIQNYDKTTISEFFREQVKSLFCLPFKEADPKNMSRKFIKGEPNVYCRDFLQIELDAMISSCLHSIKKNNEKPVAVLVSGLPGAGKSSSAYTFFNERKFERDSFVLIDDDIIRSFHKQLMYEQNNPNRQFKNLMQWFMNEVDYNQNIFQKGDSLFDQILKNNMNFLFSAIMDHSGCFDLIQYVSHQNYHIEFIFVHTLFDKCVKRAKERAYKTGRWTSKKFIESRIKSLYIWLEIIVKFVLSVNGNVIIYDNSKENDLPTLLFNSIKDDHKIILQFIAEQKKLFGCC